MWNVNLRNVIERRQSLEHCQERCEADPVCHGIEYNDEERSYCSHYFTPIDESELINTTGVFTYRFVRCQGRFYTFPTDWGCSSNGGFIISSNQHSINVINEHITSPWN